MITTTAVRVMLAARTQAARLLERAQAHRDDEGVSTLEAVILILGGMTLALMLYAAVRQAVETRIAQIR